MIQHITSKPSRIALLSLILGAAPIGQQVKAMSKNKAEHETLSEAQTELFDAILRPNIEKVGKAIQEGADINYQYTTIDGFEMNGETPLCIACTRGDTEKAQFLIQFLIKNKADIDKPDHSGNTPLIIASKNDSFEIVKLLIENGANHNPKNYRGKTALDVAKNCSQTQWYFYEYELFKATYNNNLNDVNIWLGNIGGFLCHRKNNIMCTDAARDKDGNTILIIASMKSYRDMVKYLLFYGGIEYGVNRHLKNNKGQTAFDVANATIAHDLWNCELLRASYDGDLEKVQKCLNNGADVNTTDDRNRTPVLIAVLNDNIDIVKYLMEKSMLNIDIKDKYERTPLDCALIYEKKYRNATVAKFIINLENEFKNFTIKPFEWKNFDPKYFYLTRLYSNCSHNKSIIHMAIIFKNLDTNEIKKFLKGRKYTKEERNKFHKKSLPTSEEFEMQLKLQNNQLSKKYIDLIID